MSNTPGIVFHQELAQSGRWEQMSISEQLGNIGSEVGRSIHAKRTADTEKLEGASWRMYELFDLAMADKRWHGTGTLREICRAREVVSEYLFWENYFGETDESLEGYFTAYWMMANNERRQKRAARAIVK